MIKRLSKYLAFSALAIAAGFFGGVLAELSRASSSPRRVPVSVRAKRFEVVDDGGKVVAELTGGALNLLTVLARFAQRYGSNITTTASLPSQTANGTEEQPLVS